FARGFVRNVSWSLVRKPSTCELDRRDANRPRRRLRKSFGGQFKSSSVSEHVGASSRRPRSEFLWLLCSAPSGRPGPESVRVSGRRLWFVFVELSRSESPLISSEPAILHTRRSER
ncbi:unnamed protein product, partial [Tenebrio molitor]